MRTVDRFERFGQKIYNGQDVLKNHILNCYPIHFTDNTDDIDVVKQYANNYEYVWLVDKTIETLNTFPWHFRPTENAIYMFPYIYKASRRIKSWKSVQLIPTNVDNNTKKITQPHICGIYDFYCGKDSFDIFFIGDKNTGTYNDLISKVSNVKCVNNFKQAQTMSTTDMFWLVPDDVEISPIFKFNYQPDDWSHKYVHVFVNGDKNNRDGIALFPKKYSPTEKELQYRYYAGKKELNIIASKPRSYDQFQFKNYQDYLDALENSKTELFWYIPSDVNVNNDFMFDLYFSHQNQFDRNINHVFLNNDSYDGIVLFSKNSPVTEKEFLHRFYANKKEWAIVASYPKNYDIFVINNFEDYQNAKSKTSTEMFWGIPDDVQLTKNLDLYFSHHNRFDRNITHVFLNNKTYDGVVLYSKNVDLTEKEIEHRFFINKKEHNEIYSTPKQFDYFNIDSYSDYLTALKKSKTELFWAGSKNINVDKKVIKNFYISHHEIIDRKQNHAFIHCVDNKNLYNGLFLLSKHKELTEHEIEYRFLVDRKEWPIVASGPVKYNIFNVETYEDYLDAFNKSKTEMFWIISPNIKIDDNFKFDLYFTHDNEYDRKNNHNFIHQVGELALRNGVFLVSKHKKLTKNEIEYRFLLNAKEWPTVASRPVQYEIFDVNTYNDYQEAMKKSKTEMFWIIPEYVNITKRFKFDTYFHHEQTFERSINHVYQNGKYYDGVVLCSKKSPITEKEFDFKFIAHKKEVPIIISTPRPYDIVFISYQEPNAEENYARLLKKVPHAKRVHGVKGIHQAHIEAAKLCSTDMFWIVDGDAVIMDDFIFDHQVARWNKDTVHVWRSQNPINDLVYGYGGVKLFPRDLTLNMDISKPDMTTSISKKFKAMNQISNITGFNTDPFNTWKSAFRECVKLSSRVIDRQKDSETEKHLQIWSSVGESRLYGNYAIAGAKEGTAFGNNNKENPEKLKLINDFDWLSDQFKKLNQSI